MFLQCIEQQIHFIKHKNKHKSPNTIHYKQHPYLFLHWSVGLVIVRVLIHPENSNALSKHVEVTCFRNYFYDLYFLYFINWIYWSNLWINTLNPELNPICYFLALLGARHFLHVSRIRVKLLIFRQLMSYIYIYIWSTHSWCF